jgi:hypothetical protein
MEAAADAAVAGAGAAEGVEGARRLDSRPTNYPRRSRRLRRKIRPLR